jgi:hypothetical protein
MAIDVQDAGVEPTGTLDLASHIDHLHDLKALIKMDDAEATVRVRKKLAKFKRAKTKSKENSRALDGDRLSCSHSNEDTKR